MNGNEKHCILQPTNLVGALSEGEQGLLLWAAYLGDHKGVPCALGAGVSALEPPLVSNLDLEDVQVAVAHSSSDQLVAATLISVSCSKARTSISPDLSLSSLQEVLSTEIIENSMACAQTRSANLAATAHCADIARHACDHNNRLKQPLLTFHAL